MNQVRLDDDVWLYLVNRGHAEKKSFGILANELIRAIMTLEDCHTREIAAHLPPKNKIAPTPEIQALMDDIRKNLLQENIVSGHRWVLPHLHH